MTPDRDIERVLEAWLEPGASKMPDRLFDAVVDRIEHVPQRRVLRLSSRFQPMNTVFKLAAVAALALAVGIGVGRLQPTGPYAPGSSPTPVASPTEPPPLLPLSFSPLDPGTYALGSPIGASGNPLARMTATVPEGWQGIRGNTFANLFQSNDDFPAGSIALAIPSNFYVDPCDTNAGLWDPPLGPTVDDFVTALANVPGYHTTDPVDVTFLGYSGKYVEEIGPPSVTKCTDGFSHPWQTLYNEAAPYDFDDQHGRLWILDVDGVRVVIDLVGSNAAPHPTGTDPASLAEQQQVFDSLRIVPAPPAATAVFAGSVAFPLHLTASATWRTQSLLSLFHRAGVRQCERFGMGAGGSGAHRGRHARLGPRMFDKSNDLGVYGALRLAGAGRIRAPPVSSGSSLAANACVALQLASADRHARRCREIRQLVDHHLRSGADDGLHRRVPVKDIDDHRPGAGPLDRPRPIRGARRPGHLVAGRNQHRHQPTPDDPARARQEAPHDRIMV